MSGNTLRISRMCLLEDDNTHITIIYWGFWHKRSKLDTTLVSRAKTRGICRWNRRSLFWCGTCSPFVVNNAWPARKKYARGRVCFSFEQLHPQPRNNTSCNIIAEIPIITTAINNGSSFIDIDTPDSLCWILVNAERTRHIIYCTNGDKSKGTGESTLGNTINGFVNSAVTTMQNTASNPRSQAFLAKRVASPSPLVNLTSIVSNKVLNFHCKSRA